MLNTFLNAVQRSLIGHRVMRLGRGKWERSNGTSVLQVKLQNYLCNSTENLEPLTRYNSKTRVLSTDTQKWSK